MLSQILNPRRVRDAARNLLCRERPPGVESCETCKPLLHEKTGIEIGGPSGICTRTGKFPIYQLFQRLDNCNFSESTIWEGAITEGSNFRYDEARAPGRQYIRDASDLHGIPSDSYDAVLSSHVLEHIANPLKAMSEWLRVLRDSGTLILIMPHKDGTFDHRRPITPLAHLIEDRKRDIGEDDLTHLPEILAMHDLELDPWAGGFENFKKRSQCNLENRCLHHHIFDTELVVLVLDHVGLQILNVECLEPYDIIAVAQKLSAGRTADNRAFLRGNANYRARSPFPSDRANRNPDRRKGRWRDHPEH